jgi:hypothetical protein
MGVAGARGAPALKRPAASAGLMTLLTRHIAAPSSTSVARYSVPPPGGAGGRGAIRHAPHHAPLCSSQQRCALATSCAAPLLQRALPARTRRACALACQAGAALCAHARARRPATQGRATSGVQAHARPSQSRRAGFASPDITLTAKLLRACTPAGCALSAPRLHGGCGLLKSQNRLRPGRPAGGRACEVGNRTVRVAGLREQRAADHARQQRGRSERAVAQARAGGAHGEAHGDARQAERRDERAHVRRVPACRAAGPRSRAIRGLAGGVVWAHALRAGASRQTLAALPMRPDSGSIHCAAQPSAAPACSARPAACSSCRNAHKVNPAAAGRVKPV